MHSSTHLQAYQLRKGGTPARLAILQMIVAASRGGNRPPSMGVTDWRAARHWGLDTYADAFALPSIGRNDGASILYTHNGGVFRNERDADDIVPSLPRGWYTNGACDETAVGIVGSLPHGRFIAGYRWTSNDERVYFPVSYDDESDAARAANGHAERFADACRDDDERYQAMTLAELECADKLTELQKAFALRHRAKFGGTVRLAQAIDDLRAAREALSEATCAYERGAA